MKKNILKNKYFFPISFYLLSLNFVFAQEVAKPDDFKSLVNLFIGIINGLIPLILVLSLIVFFWGLAKFILKSGDEKEIASGRNLMIWGTIIFFVFISVWGIVYFLSSSLGLNNNSSGENVIPQLSFPLDV